jgi:hypothetical protein
MNLPTPISLYTPPSVVHLNSESKFNQIHGVNELVIVMALAEDNLPQSVTVPTGSIAASAVTTPLEDLPPTIPLISIWDDKEHIIRLDVDGAKTWLCKGCNQPPTSHWNAAKALAHVSNIYGASRHVLVCKVIIPPAYLAWYQNLSYRKIQRKNKNGQQNRTLRMTSPQTVSRSQ